MNEIVEDLKLISISEGYLYSNNDYDQTTTIFALSDWSACCSEPPRRRLCKPQYFMYLVCDWYTYWAGHNMNPIDYRHT